MSDKQFIEMLKKIKKHCHNQGDCNGCDFFSAEAEAIIDGVCARCQLRKIACALTTVPSCWDMETIERIINE